MVVFIKDSRESNNLDSDDEDTAANERLQDVVGDITTSFCSARNNSQLIQIFYFCAITILTKNPVHSLSTSTFSLFFSKVDCRRIVQFCRATVEREHTSHVKGLIQ